MRDNTGKGQFEIETDGHITFARYRLEGDNLFIDHVEAPPELRGSGVAGKLMEEIVKLAASKGYDITPICSYAAVWLKRNKEKLG